MIRRTLSNLLKQLNNARGLIYPDVGYTFVADIKGDGSNRSAVWTVSNPSGGIVRSELNGKSRRETCAKVRAAIAAQGSNPTPLP